MEASKEVVGAGKLSDEERKEEGKRKRETEKEERTRKGGKGEEGETA